MSIRVLYDEQGFLEPHGGVSRLFSEVMRNLPEGFEWKLGPVCTRNAYLQEPPFNLPCAKGDVSDFIRDTLHGRGFRGVSHVYKFLGRVLPRMFPSGELANERALKAAFRKGDFDIFHTTVPHPMFNNWSPVVGKKPIVETVVDMIPDFSRRLRRRYFRQRLLNDAAHVIAITEKTKQDMMTLYDVPEEKISVVYLGYSMRSQVNGEDVDLKAKWDLAPQQFFLFVGKRDGYKNFAWMVRALVPFLKDGFKLFCTGFPFTESEKALFRELKVEPAVVQSFVSDAEMNALFRSAAAFIHPSRYEGFGIPILDSFAAECPALLANASCFPEVARDAALYFDPKDIDSLREQVNRLLGNGALRTELIAKGTTRVKDFSWKKCAEETAAVYAKLV